MRIAILSVVFKPEFGVARVISSQLPYLVQAGFDVDLYVCELDKSLLIPGVCAVRVPTHFKGLLKALRLGNYDLIVVHTDPFYKMLADSDLAGIAVGYEHGNPPIELCLPEEREQRLKEIKDKPSKVYPKLLQIVTISNFAVKYLQWDKAAVIYNGADHCRNDSCLNEVCSSKKQILCVSRFRESEWTYKGLDLVCKLKQDLGDSADVVVIGRGASSTTKKLQDCGITVKGCVSAEELALAYKTCDALVSFSKWELFNLPLVEAGFSHKAALALNIGPHAEVTPFVYSSYAEIRDYLKNSTKESLQKDGEKMFCYVDARFRWEYNGKNLVQLLRELCKEPNRKRRSPLLKMLWAYWNLREFLRQKFYKKLLRR